MSDTKRRLNQKQRQAVLNSVRMRVLKHHFNVADVDYNEWLKHYDERAEKLALPSDRDFEAGIQQTLNELRSSHTAFYHEQPNRLLPQHTINATLSRFVIDNQERWCFLDVFDEGPAQRAGIKPGEVLHSVDNSLCAPPNMPGFRTGFEHALSVSAPDGSAYRVVSIDVPKQKGTKNVPPIMPPKSITISMIAAGTGLLRVAWFPGSMGLNFSKELDRAVDRLKEQNCDSLIVDLRGNIGGGLGFARLASYLCPDQRPIGYSLTPKRQRAGYAREQLTQVVYPSSRIGFAKTLIRFAAKDKSIFLLTQGLGPQPFHGKIVILVNQWTNSAAEMVAAFAAENGFATIIGTRTAGNVLGAINFKVGSGHWLRLPVFGWYTTVGNSIEGCGVNPDIAIEPNALELSRGTDVQLDTAVRFLDPQVSGRA